MKVVCCDCKKLIREKPGPDDRESHSWCERCVVKVKKELWEMIHVTGNDVHYHPWATDDGKFFIYKSEPYRGGVVWSKKMVCESVTQAEETCKELNG